MRDDDADHKREVSAEQRPRKQPYAKPKMREYGSIAKLTQSGGSTRNEAGGGMRGCL